MRERIITLLVVGAAVILTPLTISANTIQVFSNRTLWEEAVAASLAESVNGNSVSPASRVGALDIEIQQLSDTTIEPGEFLDPLDGTPFWRIPAVTKNGPTSSVAPIVCFDSLVTALGVDFTYSFAPPATMLLAGQTLTFPTGSEFFGVVSPVPFDRLKFDVAYPFPTRFHAGALSIRAVPEPATLTLLGMGALGLAACAWRRR